MSKSRDLSKIAGKVRHHHVASDSADFTGNVTAASFSGDGANLTNAGFNADSVNALIDARIDSSDFSTTSEINALIDARDTHDSVAVQGQFDSALPVALALDVSLGNITTSGYIRGPATFTLDPAAHNDSTGTLRVLGNLTVEGTTTTINSTTVETSDLALALAKDAVDSAACAGAGITVASAGANFTYDHTNAAWNSNKHLTVDGNVGVGTTSPADIVTLSGSGSQPAIRLITDAGTYNGVYHRIFPAGDGTALAFSADKGNSGAGSYIRFDVDDTEHMRIDSSGKVGIGTASPSSYLSEGSNLVLSGSGHSGMTIASGTSSEGGIYFADGTSSDARYRGIIRYNHGSNYLQFYTSAAERMRLETDGDLHVDGDVIAYSTTTSDIRLKDNVKTIENGLDKVCSLRGVSYTWNAGSREGQQEIGVIAQEVEQVFPEIVREKELALLDGNSYKTVDYEKLVGVLIEAVKELKAEIDELKSV
jgi:hypothetical protein